MNIEYESRMNIVSIRGNNSFTNAIILIVQKAILIYFLVYYTLYFPWDFLKNG